MHLLSLELFKSVGDHVNPIYIDAALSAPPHSYSTVDCHMISWTGE